MESIRIGAPGTLRRLDDALIAQAPPERGAPPTGSTPQPTEPHAATVAPHHEVRRGDTLWGIAERELGDGHRYRELLRANPGIDPERLMPGQRVQLPQAAPPQPPAPPPPVAPTAAPAATAPPAPGTGPAAPAATAPPAPGTAPAAPAATAPPAPGTAATPRPAGLEVAANAWAPPSGSGPNTTLTPFAMFGARWRSGAGESPTPWLGVSGKPYTEVFAGWSVQDLTFDAQDRLQVVKPRYVAGASFGDGGPNGRNLTMMGWRDAAPDPRTGQERHGAQATYASLKNGRPDARLDLRVESEPAGANTSPALAARAEKFVPLDPKNALRLRGTVGTSGLPETVPSWQASLALNQQPLAGNFPAANAPFVPAAELSYTRTSTPAPGAPGRYTDAAAIMLGATGPRTVINTTLTAAKTVAPGVDDVNRLLLSGSAIQRLGPNDVGGPPTTVRKNFVDPVNMPTGRFTPGQQGQNTTLYSRFTVTLQDDGPPPILTPGVAGRDSAELGVVHTRSHGVLSSAYVQATYDPTTYAAKATPAGGRTGVDLGVHLRPTDSLPVTVHLGGHAGIGGESIRGDLMIQPDKQKDLTVGLGARYMLSGPTEGELQPLVGINLRL
jgi:LysM repeat protein